MERTTGFEPVTSSLARIRTTTVLSPHMPLILLLSAGATSFPYTDRQSGTPAERLLNGATDGLRSHDINLGKVALYQLSYCRMKMVKHRRIRTDI